jgi:hypothetical protein
VPGVVRTNERGLMETGRRELPRREELAGGPNEGRCPTASDGETASAIETQEGPRCLLWPPLLASTHERGGDAAKGCSTLLK